MKVKLINKVKPIFKVFKGELVEDRLMNSIVEVYKEFDKNPSAGSWERAFGKIASLMGLSTERIIQEVGEEQTVSSLALSIQALELAGIVPKTNDELLLCKPKMLRSDGDGGIIKDKGGVRECVAVKALDKFNQLAPISQRRSCLARCCARLFSCKKQPVDIMPDPILNSCI